MGDVGVGHEVGVQVAGGRHDGRREARPAVLADQRGIVRLSITQLLEMILGRKSFNRWLVGARAGTSRCEEDVFVSPVSLRAKSFKWITAVTSGTHVPLSIPTTQLAFIEWQSTIHRYLPPPKMKRQKPKATAKVVPIDYLANFSKNAWKWRWGKCPLRLFVVKVQSHLRFIQLLWLPELIIVQWVVLY